MKRLRYIARTILILIALTWFTFALLSGAGEGVAGISANAPNALPWLALFVLVGIAWKWEHIGGLLIIAAGLFSIFFFNALREPVVFFAISVPLIILGGLFVALWRMDNNAIKE